VTRIGVSAKIFWVFCEFPCGRIASLIWRLGGGMDSSLNMVTLKKVMLTIFPVKRQGKEG
jgi:hypothetical protein